MTPSQMIEIMMLVVTFIAAVAAWLALPGSHRAVSKAQHVLGVFILTLVAAIAVVTAVVMFARTELPREPLPRDTGGAKPPVVLTAPAEPVPTGTTFSVAETTTGPIPTNTAPQQLPIQPVPAPVPAPAVSQEPPAPDRSNEVQARWRHALDLSSSSEWNEAAVAWRTFVDDYSGRDANTDRIAYYNLGVAYEALHQWSEAIDAFEHSLHTGATRSDVKSLLRLGHCYTKLGRWSDSTTACEEALRVDPNNAVAKRCVFLSLKQQPPTE